MKKVIILLILASSFWIGATTSVENVVFNLTSSIDKNTPVWDVLKMLGEDLPNHTINESIKGVSAERGKGLIVDGSTKSPKGRRVSKQSKHFVCTSCHNIKKEDPDLSVSDPQARLEYVSKNNMPFLQGTTFYGAVNRITFYNGDYDKKYGDLVKPARNNIREAIKLCAVECAQGRSLKDWELESIVAYLWDLQLRMGDLNLSDADLKAISDAVANHKSGKDEKTIQLIKSKYLDGSPAHFIAPPPNRKEGFTLTGDPVNGKLIYELSCQHCHANGRYSFFDLDDAKVTFKYLKSHLSKYTRYSLYQVARYGTSPMNWKRAYMPQYPVEKMSNQQLEDLRAYIEQEAS